MRHDKWSKMGEEHLGEMNLRFSRLHDDGCFTLMKCIINDYWADAPPQTEGWDREKIDMVMSKIYYCWVAMLEKNHPLDENESWQEAREEDLE